jgi:hypothetical protein
MKKLITVTFFSVFVVLAAYSQSGINDRLTEKPQTGAFYPVNMTEEQRNRKASLSDFPKQGTPEWQNPCVGEDANLTFHSQSTFILPVQGKKDAFIFMADRWKPEHPIDGRYIWLPVLFENGLPVLKWTDKWDLNIFEKSATTYN